MKREEKTKRIKMLTIIAFILIIAPMSWIVYGTDERDITYTIQETVSEEGTVATLKLEIMASNKVKEIVKIRLPDGSDIDKQSNIIYEITENGEYEFIVCYKVLQEDETNEYIEVDKQEVITYQVETLQEKQLKLEEPKIENPMNEDAYKAQESEVSLASENSEMTEKGSVSINETNFPDENFRDYIQSLTGGEDGTLTSEELAKILTIDVNREVNTADQNKIKDLTGIHYFTSLQALTCTNNALESLDVSKNVNLNDLRCNNNKLKNLTLPNANSDGSFSLSIIYCNVNYLTTLDVSKYSQLTTLVCPSNNLSTLDISNNQNLIYIRCNNNLLTEITGINTGKERSALNELVCSNNKLTTLDLSTISESLSFSGANQQREIPMTLVSNQWVSNKNINYGITSIDNKKINYSSTNGQFTASQASSPTSSFTTDCTDKKNNVYTLTGVLSFTYQGFIPVTDITNAPNAMSIGETLTLSATVVPENASKKNIDWKITNAGVTGAKLNNNQLYANAEGIVEVEAKIADATNTGDYTKSFTIVVNQGRSIVINDANFPDQKFQEWLLAKSSISGYGVDGILTTSEIEQVTSIDVSKNAGIADVDKIKNLEGIKYFTKLVSLNCSGNLLETLVISNNLYLENLYCNKNKLIELDVSQNIALKLLECAENRLEKLELNTNKSLNTLKCYSNQLVTLDLLQNTQLSVVDMSQQSYEIPLTLDKGQWKSDKNIKYGITSINDDSNITYNSGQFTIGYASNKAIAFTTICKDGSKVDRKLTGTLQFNYQNFIPVSSIEGVPESVAIGESVLLTNTVNPNNASHKDIKWSIHDPTQTGAIITDGNTLYASKTGVVKLKASIDGGTLEGKYWEFSINIIIGNSIEINEKNFPDNLFRSYVETLPGSDDTIFTASELEKITLIDVSKTTEEVDTNKIISLNGIEHFTKIKTLLCTNNLLTELDLSKNTELVSLICANNVLTKLNVNTNTNLQELRCYGNRLTELDVSQNTELLVLYCNGRKNQENLKTLDVSKNTKLTTLVCPTNELATLNVSKNTELLYIRCNNNNLRELDISSNRKLIGFDCSANQLLSLKHSKNAELTQYTVHSQRRVIPMYLRDGKWISDLNEKDITINLSDTNDIIYDSSTGQFIGDNAATKYSDFITECKGEGDTIRTIDGRLSFAYDGFVPVKNITNIPSTIKVGESIVLNSSVEPTNATEKAVTWSIKDIGTTEAILIDNNLTVNASGTVVVTATIRGGMEQRDFTQDFRISTYSAPSALISIPRNINLEKVKNNDMFEAIKDEKVSILSSTDTTIFKENFYIQTEPKFYLMNIEKVDEWFTAQIYDESNNLYTSRDIPLAVLNNTTKSKNFYIKAFKDIAREPGIYQGIMTFSITYGESK